jgi:hypothetical protein
MSCRNLCTNCCRRRVAQSRAITITASTAPMTKGRGSASKVASIRKTHAQPQQCRWQRRGFEHSRRARNAHGKPDGADVDARLWQLDPIPAPQSWLHVIANDCYWHERDQPARPLLRPLSRARPDQICLGRVLRILTLSGPQRACSNQPARPRHGAAAWDTQIAARTASIDCSASA